MSESVSVRLQGMLQLDFASRTAICRSAVCNEGGLYILIEADGTPFMLADPQSPEGGETDVGETVLPVWSDSEAAEYFAARSEVRGLRSRRVPLRVWNESWVPTLRTQKVQIGWEPLCGDFEVTVPEALPEGTGLVRGGPD